MSNKLSSSVPNASNPSVPEGEHNCNQPRSVVECVVSGASGVVGPSAEHADVQGGLPGSFGSDPTNPSGLLKEIKLAVKAAQDAKLAYSSLFDLRQEKNERNEPISLELTFQIIESRHDWFLKYNHVRKLEGKVLGLEK